MDRFSERYGHVSTEEVYQVDSANRELRISVWNAFKIAHGARNFYTNENESFRAIVRHLYLYFFIEPIDSISEFANKEEEKIKEYILNCDWYKVYDFIEFIIDTLKESENRIFSLLINEQLESHKSGYRLVQKNIVPIVSSDEIDEINRVFTHGDKFKNVKEHIASALRLIGDKENPDHRNAIKESISAVEAVCRIAADDEKATLGAALKSLRRSTLHPAMVDAFNKLYGYTSDGDGIRHALLKDSEIGPSLSRFMVIACSAFVNYIIAELAD